MVDVETLAAGIRDGNRRALAKAVTLIESTRSDHRQASLKLLEHLAPFGQNAFRIGISGSPGVGKSTFIEPFGLHIIDTGKRVAVLSVDPSSSISGGSILGDKTRMEQLSRNPHAFIRPSPSGGTLGGAARRTREAILLCEAAGFDIVIVETVGVGQTEIAVSQMTDMFVVLLQPAAGDELQGIKRGIMELADLVLVNKADGDLVAAARRAAADYRLALSLLHPRSKDWKVPVELCSALNGEGIDDAWNTVCEYRALLEKTGELTARRAAQSLTWMWNEISESLIAAFRGHARIRDRLPEIAAEVKEGRLLATVAAQKLLEIFFVKE